MANVAAGDWFATRSENTVTLGSVTAVCAHSDAAKALLTNKRTAFIASTASSEEGKNKAMFTDRVNRA